MQLEKTTMTKPKDDALGPPTSADDPVVPSVSLTDILHSGHLFYILRRARAGFEPSRKHLLEIYCEVIEKGEHPRPAVNAFVAGAVRAILDGGDANQAFGQVRNKAGRPPQSQKGDFFPIIVEGKERTKLMRMMPEYRDWILARDVAEIVEGGDPLKYARSVVAKRYGVSDSTVHRAIKKFKNPDLNQKALNDSFQASREGNNQFQNYVQKHSGSIAPEAIAASWRRRSLSYFRRLGNVAASKWPNETADSAWFKNAVADEEFAKSLFLYLDPRDVQGHSATTSEVDARNAFVRAFEKSRA